ncbi:hypothetical protein AAC387_Pa02g3616 [Persea americana]
MRICYKAWKATRTRGILLLIPSLPLVVNWCQFFSARVSTKAGTLRLRREWQENSRNPGIFYSRSVECCSSFRSPCKGVTCWLVRQKISGLFNMFDSSLQLISIMLVGK